MQDPITGTGQESPVRRAAEKGRQTESATGDRQEPLAGQISSRNFVISLVIGVATVSALCESVTQDYFTLDQLACFLSQPASEANEINFLSDTVSGERERERERESARTSPRGAAKSLSSRLPKGVS